MALSTIMFKVFALNITVDATSHAHEHPSTQEIFKGNFLKLVGLIGWKQHLNNLDFLFYETEFFLKKEQYDHIKYMSNYGF